MRHVGVDVSIDNANKVFPTSKSKQAIQSIIDHAWVPIPFPPFLLDWHSIGEC